MLRISFLFFCVLSVTSCTTTRIQNPEKASKLNAELGLAYILQGRNEQGLAKLNKAIKINPDNAKAYSYIAELYRRLNENERAEDYFKRALDIDSKDPSINNNYGAFLCANKKYDDAFKYLKIALLNPVYTDRGKVYENIGVCAEDKGNLKIARENYIQAINLQPNLGNSLLSVAQLDFDAQNIKSAEKFLNYYTRVAKHTPQSLWLGILIASKKKNKNTVESLSWSLERKFPMSKEAKLLKKLRASGEL